MILVDTIERGGSLVTYRVKIGMFDVKLCMLNVNSSAPRHGCHLAQGSYG
jgi:hypothetical protein